MVMINLEASTIERMKGLAEPLVDTHDSLVNRALDALEAQIGKKPDAVLNPASPPNLAHTTVKSVTFKGKVLPANETYWNSILLAVASEAGNHFSKSQLDHLITVNHVLGKKDDNGYKYVEEIDISIQGQDANYAWRATYKLLEAAKLPIEVVFHWQDNPKAARPGEMGRFIVNP